VAGEPQLVAAGERVALGPIRRDLLDRYVRWVNELEVRHGLVNLGLYTPESEEAWYAEASAAMGKPEPESVTFTIYDRSDGAPVGTTSLFTIQWRLSRARFGILLGERRGAGLGTEATRLTLDWAFTVLGLHNVMLEVLPWNTRAIRAYEKAGFRPVGRRRDALISFGRRCDEVLMDAVASEFEGSVLSPREMGPQPPA
jgi:diamine N-acetyltransferase